MPNPIPITWSPTLTDIFTAIYWSCKKIKFSIDRSNMNVRRLSESLDDKIMGDIATISMGEYLYSINIPVVAYDEIRNDNFEKPDPGWDIAFGKNIKNWMATMRDPSKPEKLFTASVKSSRLPRYDTLQTAIETRDFKILFHPMKSIEECITSDIEMQIYYDFNKTQLGSREITQDNIENCINDYKKANKINILLDIQNRYGSCYLTAWNLKKTIVKESKLLFKPTWISRSAGHVKEMWRAPLKSGKSMQELKIFT